MYNIVYKRNKYFENQIFFHFLIENFMPTNNAPNYLFSILSIFRVLKIFVMMMKKKLFLQNNLCFIAILKKLMEPRNP
jgi:hypothetical protein